MASASKQQPLVVIKNLRKHFPVRSGFLSGLTGKENFVHAVDGVTFDIRRGEVLSLVGESGCGKTTMARLILRLLRPTEGTITFDGQDLFKTSRNEIHKIRLQMQAVFQDPYSSLDPKKTIHEVVSEPLTVNHLVKNRKETYLQVSRALTSVGLTPPQSFMGKFPYELSGGQRQRVAIARATVINPSFIVADEPVSMLDVSIRAEILSLILGLKERYNLTYLFITHDLAVARYVSTRMAVMYLGKIAEIGPAEDICTQPAHPYTKALLAALPTTDPRKRHHEIGLRGEVPDAIDIPTGCRFGPRCLSACEKCQEEPELKEVGRDHFVACCM
jgi:peptide/nickel transport system ATP-binding protein